MFGGSIPIINTVEPFTFDLNSTVDDGSSSPRSRVAHRFQGLTLGGGSGVSGDEGISLSMDSSTASSESENGSRKRRKLPDVEMTDVDGQCAVDCPAGEFEATQTSRSLSPQSVTENDIPSKRQHSRSPKSIRFALDTAIVGRAEILASTFSDTDSSGNTSTIAAEDSPSPSPTASRQKSPDRNKPHRQAIAAIARRRASTPPLAPRPRPGPSGERETAAISDPLRASLTWHDDEITIYDPDDSDDDGTGINGIGFKPTPAIAYARTVRRKQQLAEYRKREEREARAKRSQRRRGSPTSSLPALVDMKGKAKAERRRVRFLENVAELIGV
jgi:hypothetical protein